MSCEISHSDLMDSTVPSGLELFSPTQLTLPRWVKLVRPLRGLWVGVILTVPATHAYAADHPEIPRGSECLACHVEKTKGQSIHFDCAQACTVCHVVTLENGKSSITLVLPKEKICYSCHEKAALDKVAYMKGECIACHDPHNSEHPHLLRADPAIGEGKSKQ